MLRELNFEGVPVTYELCSTGRYFATNATLLRIFIHTLTPRGRLIALGYVLIYLPCI